MIADLILWFASDNIGNCVVPYFSFVCYLFAQAEGGDGEGSIEQQQWKKFFLYAMAFRQQSMQQVEVH